MGIGVPLLAALGALLFLWSREKKRSRDYQQQVTAAGQHPPWGKPLMGYAPGTGMRGQTYCEVPGQAGDYGVAEMPGGDWRREMAASSTMKS